MRCTPRCTHSNCGFVHGFPSNLVVIEDPQLVPQPFCGAHWSGGSLRHLHMVFVCLVQEDLTLHPVISWVLLVAYVLQFKNQFWPCRLVCRGVCELHACGNFITPVFRPHVAVLPWLRSWSISCFRVIVSGASLRISRRLYLCFARTLWHTFGLPKKRKSCNVAHFRYCAENVSLQMELSVSCSSQPCICVLVLMYSHNEASLKVLTTGSYLQILTS
jgi:hypothetical protein